ncbi:MAG TPA: GAF domain-containing sensor histidine kinase [Candidatus Eisenbacteria bacterium]|nr:GAF domain-containing sensor histidine kinase [Candidatus Eisenbacteria bacterium]
MAARPTEQIQAQLESRVWWLIGLSILLILALSATIPVLLMAMVKAGLLDAAFESGGGFGIVAGLLGLTLIFSLTLVQRVMQLNAIRRRLLVEQLELEQSKSRLSELTSLFQLDNSLHMRLPLQTILDITVRRIGSTLHAHEVDIFLLSKETKSLRCAASFGLTARRTPPDAPYGEGPVGVCARRRQSVLVPAPDAGSPFTEHLAANPGIGSMILVPVIAEKVCIGVLQIARAATAEPFRAEHRDLARLFADNIGPVIDRSRGDVAAPRSEGLVEAADSEPSVAGPFQDSFLQSAGHELKSPLTAIVAYADVLDQNDGRMAPAMRAEFSGRVRSEAERLARLVDDVLDVVRLELGRYVLELRIARVNDIVKEAVEAVRGHAAAKGIPIGVALDESISSQHLDPAKLRHSVVQLLRNAIASSPAKGRVAIATKLEDGNVRITVLDQGPAITASRPEDVFEIDVLPAGGEERAKHGFGFGLHLAKRFAELHGGRAGAGRSSSGETALWIELPWTDSLSSLVGEDAFADELTRF